MSKFRFTLEFRTDGDFGIDFMPIGTYYDGNEHYKYSAEYDNKRTAERCIQNILGRIKSDIYGKAPVVDEVEAIIDEFLNEFINVNEQMPYIEKRMYGNQDGTYISFSRVDEVANFCLRCTDEEYALFDTNPNGVTNGEVKKTLMNLFNTPKECR